MLNSAFLTTPHLKPSSRIPVCRPLLPMADKILPYLQKIDQTRYYSNQGPLLQEFESRLAYHFDVHPDRIVTSANGTMALTQLLRAYDIESGALCVMPSWTFIATPAAAVAAQLTPYFIDVDPNTWAIRPQDIHFLLKTQSIGAVIVVSPFGAPINCKEWEDFSEEIGIPVIIDAAGGFDSFSQLKTTLPFMVSLHATKVIGMGEGAVIVMPDATLAKRGRSYGNFGFADRREAIVQGTNGKVSEYAAAVGLAALGEWPQKRADWLKLSDEFQNQMAPLTSVPQFNEGWVSSFGNVTLPTSVTTEQASAHLNQLGIGSVLWWGKGCHAHQAYQSCPRGDLSVTEDLADRVLGLPFWLGLRTEETEIVFQRLAELL